MKILLIYTQEDKKNAGLLEPLLIKMGIPFDILPLVSPEDRDITHFTGFFASPVSMEKDDRPTHGVILSSLSKQWFAFLAGFTYGSNVPLMVYGQGSIPGISEEFASFFSFIETEDSLQNFLEAENEASKKQEAARGIIKAQEKLLQMGVPVTAESLAQCAAEGRILEMSYFLAAGFSPNTRNKTGVPLLNLAARNGKNASIRYLIESKADLNLRAEDRGSTALVDSVMGKHFGITSDLIGAGADLNITSKDGQTALIVAVGIGNDMIVEALLKAGADTEVKDSLGVSARKYAALFSNPSIKALFSNYPAQEAV